MRRCAGGIKEVTGGLGPMCSDQPAVLTGAFVNMDQNYKSGAVILNVSMNGGKMIYAKYAAHGRANLALSQRQRCILTIL